MRSDKSITTRTHRLVRRFRQPKPLLVHIRLDQDDLRRPQNRPTIIASIVQNNLLALCERLRAPAIHGVHALNLGRLDERDKQCRPKTSCRPSDQYNLLARPPKAWDVLSEIGAVFLSHLEHWACSTVLGRAFFGTFRIGQCQDEGRDRGDRRVSIDEVGGDRTRVEFRGLVDGV